MKIEPIANLHGSEKSPNRTGGGFPVRASEEARSQDASKGRFDTPKSFVMGSTAYLAPVGLEDALEKELKKITARHERLFVAEGPPQKVYFAQNIWIDPQTIAFESISEAARQLRSLSGLWAYYPYQNPRRGELIAGQLPYFLPKKLPFPAPAPSSQLGSWTLLDSHTLFASTHCSSPFAHGEVHFKETRIPPSRAYLKLWELFTRIGKWPKKNDRCLEIGASPGGWTWVLQQFGACVTAVDRAPLDPGIAALPNITALKKDAFSILPSDGLAFDWILSDVVCYPDKLLRWVLQWLEAKPKTQFICTLKFQGQDEYDIIRGFEAIPDSHLIHLFHNKHELTWFRIV